MDPTRDYFKDGFTEPEFKFQLDEDLILSARTVAFSFLTNKQITKDSLVENEKGEFVPLEQYKKAWDQIQAYITKLEAHGIDNTKKKLTEILISENAGGCTPKYPTFTILHGTELISKQEKKFIRTNFALLQKFGEIEFDEKKHVFKLIDPDYFAILSHHKPKTYKWIPSWIEVNEGGKVVRISHIEHCDVYRFPGCYKSVAILFEKFLPLFKQVISIRDDLNKFQVIVKSQLFRMPPGSSYDGMWHVEGVAEHIYAVGLYYYSYSSLLSGGEIAFRPRTLSYIVDIADDTKVPITEGTAVVFTNVGFAHKLCKVINTK